MSFWANKRVLITGHTGFKGSWLSLWLNRSGAQVHGFSLPPPTHPSLYVSARVASFVESVEGDIRDFDAVCRHIRECHPEIIIHMAAQSLVRRSYANPVDTYATNVMGTVHVLESARECGVPVVLNITSDKCYENLEVMRSYIETDRMGGYDPYSSSKGCAELVTSAYRRSFAGNGSGLRIASARAGNVIGGGDWAEDRLVPDCIRALMENEIIVVRRPDAIRPWQHVLEPLAGYLSYAENLMTSGPAEPPEALNFGPADTEVRPVREVVGGIAERWGAEAAWRVEPTESLHEAKLLTLDSSLARNQLGWQPKWSFGEALDHTVDWYRSFQDGDRMDNFTITQIAAYESCGA
jgi:CDP-glucose 4,6-dehydratase